MPGMCWASGESQSAFAVRLWMEGKMADYGPFGDPATGYLAGSGWIRHGGPAREKRTRRKITRGTVIMRRLIIMLAAGMFAAGTVLTTAGVASAGTAPINR